MKFLLIVCALLLTKTESSSVVTEVVEEIDLENYQLDPDGTPFFKQVELSMPNEINYVAVFTDWWKKRPTEIVVWKVNPDGTTEQVGYQHSTEYDSMICGDWDNLAVKCSYPDNPTARILVELDKDTTSKDFLIRISGLLDDNQSFTILKTLQLLR